MKKVLFIFGTRPEAIKMAPVINVFKKYDINFKTIVAVTAQHREMLDQVLSLFEITPDFDLDLMTSNQTLEILTNKILLGISELFMEIKPDLVFVQGDTTTTFATSLAAFYQKIPVAHIEAGLRTNNIYSPFPEEINRRMTSSIASFHFPPTEQSRQNLLNEGVRDENIKVSGNTVIDALMIVSKKLDSNSHEHKQFFINKFDIRFYDVKTILVTGHRRESFGKGFENICIAIRNIAVNNDVQIIYPVHLNPNVQEPVYSILGGINNIYLIEPLDYEPFVYLMNKSDIILTDSGGIQEEAPSLCKPVLVMRNNTERPEGIDAGTAKLVGTNVDDIIREVETLIFNQEVYHQISKAVNPYGDGNAASRIFSHIESRLTLKAPIQ